MVDTVVVHQDGGMGFLTKSRALVEAQNQLRVKFCVHTVTGNRVFPSPFTDDQRPWEDFPLALGGFNEVRRDLGPAVDDEGDDSYDTQHL